MFSSDDSSSDDDDRNAFLKQMQEQKQPQSPSTEPRGTPTSTPSEVENHANKLLNEIDDTSDDVARAGNDPEHRAQVERLRESARRVRESARQSRRQRSRSRSHSPRRSRSASLRVDNAGEDEPPLLVEPPPLPPAADDGAEPVSPDAPVSSDSTVTTTTTSIGDFFRKIGTHLQSGMDSANDIDSSATVHVARQVEGVTYTSAAPYRIVFFVLKAFVLACVAVYTFTINTNRCHCAADVRKPLVQWGSVVALVMAVVALVYPKVYSDAPALKLVMMVVSLLVAYGVITYFPMLQHRGCECARPDDWRRWVVEGAVYLVLVLFVLAVVGVGVV